MKEVYCNASKASFFFSAVTSTTIFSASKRNKSIISTNSSLWSGLRHGVCASNDASHEETGHGRAVNKLYFVKSQPREEYTVQHPMNVPFCIKQTERRRRPSRSRLIWRFVACASASGHIEATWRASLEVTTRSRTRQASPQRRTKRRPAVSQDLWGWRCSSSSREESQPTSHIYAIAERGNVLFVRLTILRWYIGRIFDASNLNGGISDYKHVSDIL